MDSQVIAADSRIVSSRKTQKPDVSSMVIGKDILELISGGMYVDPMSMVREYIQNAVDAIDEASRKGKYKAKNAQIRLTIDRDNRSIVIRDNGIGIGAQKFERAMVSVGASQKVDTEARGFRGVGRFAGLSYCRELIFRTSCSAENTISEIKWDGVQFKKLVADRDYEGDLKSFLNEIAEVSFDEAALKTDHYFEVELRGVVRYKNDMLLNEEEVYDYLSQHAPVPFDPGFKFGSEIEEFLKENNVYSAYEICVENCGEERTVYRPYRDQFSLSDSVSDKFKRLELVEVEGMHGGVAAVGWILHHSYLGVIPSSQLIRGLRVREGNIQIGQSNLLTEAFPEPRFNSWSVGELHIVNRQLVPTGRRDDFEVNARYADFIGKIATYGRNIARICRQNSAVRNKIKEFELEEERVRVNLDVLKQGAISKKYKDELIKSNSVSMDKMSAVANSENLNTKDQSKLLKKVDGISKIANSGNTASETHDPLSSYSRQKRQIYQNVFDLICECSANRVVARRLIEQILVRLP
ncbi:MAG: ATP-binding protein [Proteobacteria bacterium]|nr:ATP-binding protein [Pseudomonadota bacterium]